MEVCVLASGSNGNAIFVRSVSTGVSILLDCGISRRQICQRLIRVGKSLNEVNGIFITHEHSDHIKGLEIISKYDAIPVYLTQGTYYGIKRRFRVNESLINIIQRNQWLEIEDVRIKTIPKSHDAIEPVAFTICINEQRLLYATDFGRPNPNLIEEIQQANVILLETNYDPLMLDQGFYPDKLKQRIRSPYGHMSNVQSAELIRDHASPHLSHLILGHLSENNNLPHLAEQEILQVLNEREDLNPQLIVASRYEGGDLIEIGINP